MWDGGRVTKFCWERKSEVKTEVVGKNQRMLSLNSVYKIAYIDGAYNKFILKIYNNIIKG